MKKFCEDVLKFLEAEYSDAYKFEISQYSDIPSENDTVELTIRVCTNYKRKLSSTIMLYIFGWYQSGLFIEERNQYRWQKELIDIIEGG